MLEALGQALQASALSRTLGASLWLYPLVNTAHIVGIALLFGAIVPLDLRLAGCWRHLPVNALRRVLLPVATCGLLLALSTGALLFVTRPLHYLGEPLFVLKLGLLAAALANASWVQRLRVRRDARWGEPMSAAWRAAALLSIVLWLAVITAGRLIGYR